MGDAPMGQQARLMSQAMRKLAGVVSKTRTTLIFINQLREKLGIMFGNPETTTGGRALKFYSSMRLDIRRISSIKQGQDVIGNRTRVKVVKNKVAPPFKETEFDIIYGEGISTEGDLLDLGVEHNIVRKSGAWYSYNDERIGQGRENAKQYLKEHPEMMTIVRTQIEEVAGVKEHKPEVLPSEAILDNNEGEYEPIDDGQPED
jgi:recombination protein RecA